MNNYFDGFLKYSNHILQVIMDESNLSVILIAIVTVGLTACFFTINKNKISNIDGETKFAEEFNKSTISTEKDVNLTEISRVSFQEKIEDEPISLGTSFTPFQEENDFTFRSLQESRQEQDVVKIKDPEILSQERDNNSFENDSTEVTPETASQKICQEMMIQSDFYKSDESESVRPNDTTALTAETENQEKFHEMDPQSNIHESESVRPNDSTGLTAETENQEKFHEMVPNIHELDESESVRPNDSTGLTTETENQEVILQSIIYGPDESESMRPDDSSGLTTETENQEKNIHVLDENESVRPDDSSGVATETENQEMCYEVTLQESNIHEPETSLQSEYEEISYEEIEESLSQESNDNPLAKDSTPNTIIQEKPEASALYQSYEEISYESDDNPLANGSEASVQYKIQVILSHIPKADSPITQKGLNYTDTSKTESESEISSQSDLSDIDDDSTLMEHKFEDRTDLKGSRSIILNDQIPVKVPLPNETALDVIDEFRLSNAVYAFNGQDLIDLEDYDEEEEIRRFLFKKNI